MKMKKNQLTMAILFLRPCWDLPHVVMMTK